MWYMTFVASRRIRTRRRVYAYELVRGGGCVYALQGAYTRVGAYTQAGVHMYAGGCVYAGRGAYRRGWVRLRER